MQLWDVLEKHGVDPNKSTVFLMRHADKRFDIRRHVGTRALALYQAVKNEDYQDGDLVVSFFGHRAKHGLLLGIWRFGDRMLATKALETGLLEGSFEPEEELGTYYYDLQELSLLDDLRLKLEVEWGKELVWRRRLKKSDSYPVSVRSECPVPFEGIDNVSLVMAELRMVIDDIEWSRELGGVLGVYLITDELEGGHYVGSAGGKGGVLQRWTDYVKTGHGGNRKLIALVETNSSRSNDFRFTLLETLPLKTPKREILGRESYWKRAIGSRTHGLNSN